ncbi:MAG TPA: molybdopterin-dependent oxidoreductase [Bdellovibrionota bacterium]|nr:molybdopterin-dependent oxidoreductase [Bdellovibrionota bacterium]
MANIDRRKFLKILGASATGTALGGTATGAMAWLWKVPDHLIEEALRGPGFETFKNSVCQLCPAGCGIRVRLIDNIPVRIDGNPTHPINRGGICPQGAAGLDFLFHPDRIQTPLIRVGPRGKGEFKAIGWDEALGKLAERLGTLRQKRTPEQLACFVYEKRGLMHETIGRFMDGFGSRNLIATDDGEHDYLPYQLLFGWKNLPAYDIENARYLLSFGANILDDGVSPLHAIHGYRKMREGAAGERGKFVFVDSRHSVTAASADVYLPILPGTHGAFALAVAYVLIKERHLDTAFLRDHVDGFESWTDDRGNRHAGFKDYVLADFYPERAAKITGVPAERIIDVARNFGRTRLSLAVVGNLGTDTTNGLWNALAVLSLNVLVGNIETKGGLLVPRAAPFSKLPVVRPDEIAKRGLNKPLLFEAENRQAPLVSDSMGLACERMAKGEPYSIDTLLVYGTNPAFDHPYAKSVRKALEKIPFIVSFSGIRDETAEYADLILPDHAFLEKWFDSADTPGIKFAHASVGSPVVNPLYQTRHTGDVLTEVAAKLGGSVAQAFPQSDFLSALQQKFKGIFASGEGTVVSGSFEESWAQFLKERGWQNLVYESFEGFWKVLAERGGWWDPTQDVMSIKEAIQTRTGKIMLRLDELQSKASEAARSVGKENTSPEAASRILAAWGIRETADAAFLPHYEEPTFTGEVKEFPYVLVTFGLLSNRRGFGSFSPLLQEMFGYPERIYWDSWVELNPHTAHEHHLVSEDWVKISSPAGSLRARVVFNEALEPHTVAVPFGMGHTSGGRYAKGVGVNPYEILTEVSDVLRGKPAKVATRVKIEKSERKVR